jgi:hypothetical protein
MGKEEEESHMRGKRRMVDPRFQYVRFNSYPSVVQKEILAKLAAERKCPKGEIVREAIHFYLRERGIDDGLIYDERDFFKEYERGRKVRRTSGISSA